MDRPTCILPWALSLCCLTALAAEPGRVDDADQPGLRPPTAMVRSFGSPLRWRVVTDHYFAPNLGLRATGGLQSTLGTEVRLGGTQRRTMPYVGLGYSTGGTSANRWGGWGLSADIGVQASGNSDLQLGVSYAF
ncbi:MAG: hypothetical protein RLZZ373_1117 [Pseudomonadota bacterium]|jgi:hypothetical protein